MKFYSSVRIDVRKGEVLKNGTDIIGAHTKVRVVKNKVAPPFRTAEFDVLYGQGISRMGELVDIGVQLDIIQKSGSWFSYDGQRIGQGREKVKDFLAANPEVARPRQRPAARRIPAPPCRLWWKRSPHPPRRPGPMTPALTSRWTTDGADRRRAQAKGIGTAVHRRRARREDR